MLTIQHTQFIGKALHLFDTLPSTNAYAAELLAKSNPCAGTVILAHHQTHGKGQFGNTWEAAPHHNLTLSIILYPRFLPVARQFALSQAIALGVRETLHAATQLPVAIKWPNDILIQQRKVAGILIQNTVQDNALSASIIGIGINVNQAAFAPHLPAAASLQMLTDTTYDLQLLLTQLCSHIETYYGWLCAAQYDTLLQQYERYLYQYRVKALYQQSATQTQLEGTIIGVDDYGRVMMQTDGGVKVFSAKEISFL